MIKILATLAAVISLFLGTGLAAWHEVRTENFIVRGDASLSTLKKFAIELEEYREFLGALTYGKRNDEPVIVPVYVMASDNSFERLFPSRDALGVYTQRIGSPIFIGNGARSYGESSVRGGKYDTARLARTVIKHEYMHHYTYKNGPTYYPIWYSEGLAEYLSTFQNKKGKGQLGAINEMRGPMLQYYRWLPWESVFGSVQGWAGNPDSEAVSLLYAQSWVATHYLRHSPEYAGKIEPYLAMIRANPNNSLGIFESAFGKTPDEVGREIKRYFDTNRFSVLSIDLSAYEREFEITSRRLDKWEEKLAFAYAERFFTKSGDDDAKDRADLAARLQSLHEERPEAIDPLIELAFLYHDAEENEEEAAKYVAILEQLAPGDSRVILLRGLVSSGLTANALFDEARKADPTNARAHYEFARTYLRAREVPEEAVDAALTAMRLSAERSNVPLVAGELLVRRGAEQEARYILEPLAVWPRDPEVRSRARRLLSRMQLGE